MEKKIWEVKNKIPDTSGLVTAAVVNTKIWKVENKIPNVSALVNKTHYEAKTLKNWGKIFYLLSDNNDNNEFTSDILNAKIKKIKNSGQIWLKHGTYNINNKSRDGFQITFVYQPTFNTIEVRKDKGTDCFVS